MSTNNGWKYYLKQEHSELCKKLCQKEIKSLVSKNENKDKKNEAEKEDTNSSNETNEIKEKKN